MDKLKRFIDCYIATETCNLQCHYCYIAQQNRFKKKLVKFRYSPEIIRKALSKERLGGTCLLNFCAGGETLLAEDVIPVIKALLEEGHYVMIVTNGTMTKRFQEMATFPKELLERLFFKFSFHYLELKRLNWLDQYFENIKTMAEVGASYTVEITPSDELIPYIDEIKQICKEKLGVMCHFTIGRDDRKKGIEVLTSKTFEEYKNIWSTFESDLFRFKSEIFYQKRKEFCYAGDWSVYLNLSTGDMKQCYCGRVLDNIYQNIEKPLNFEAVGCHCSQPHCYNGHAFLALGDIPELKTPTYAQLRNRKTPDGKEWLQPKMKQFMSQKLYENNEQYSKQRKHQVNRTYQIKLMQAYPMKMWKKVVKKLNDKKHF